MLPSSMPYEVTSLGVDKLATAEDEPLERHRDLMHLLPHAA